MSRLTPTIGRVLHVYIGTQPITAGIITRVFPEHSEHAPYYIGVSVQPGTAGDGAVFREMPLIEEGDHVPSGLNARWMPYQVDKAKEEETKQAPPSHVDRMIVEQKALAEKITKLDKFLASGQAMEVGYAQHQLLTQQRAAMGAYLSTLSARIALS